MLSVQVVLFVEAVVWVIVPRVPIELILKVEEVEFQPTELETQAGGPPVTPAAVAVVVCKTGTGTTVPRTVSVTWDTDDWMLLLSWWTETVTGWTVVWVIVECASKERVLSTVPVVVTVTVLLTCANVEAVTFTVRVLLTPTVTVTTSGSPLDT